MLRTLLMAAVLARAAEAVPEAPPLDEPTAEPAASERAVEDPNVSRLMLSPTAWPLRKGQGYFSNHELVFPGFGYGLTDNVSLAAGVSTIPGTGASQLVYFSPKVAYEISDRAAVAVAGLVTAVTGEDGLVGAAFGLGTWGSRDTSLSAGVGALRVLGAHFSETHPLLMVGGQARLSDSVALVTENWRVLESSHDAWLPQLHGVALRFFTSRLSADVGVVIIPELLEEGYPIPWVSFTYYFGERGKGRASRRAAAPSPLLPMLTAGPPRP